MLQRDHCEAADECYHRIWLAQKQMIRSQQKATRDRLCGIVSACILQKQEKTWISSLKALKSLKKPSFNFCFYLQKLFGIQNKNANHWRTGNDKELMRAWSHWAASCCDAAANWRQILLSNIISRQFGNSAVDDFRQPSTWLPKS